jgi:hypothetical protein
MFLKGEKRLPGKPNSIATKQPRYTSLRGTTGSPYPVRRAQVLFSSYYFGCIIAMPLNDVKQKSFYSSSNATMPVYFIPYSKTIASARISPTVLILTPSL